jgi:hypothetical protein
MTNPKEPTTRELDHMLRTLRDMPVPEPSAEIRDNLRRMIATSPERVALDLGSPAKRYWLRWASFGAACASVLVGVAIHNLGSLHNVATPNAVSVAPVAHTEAAPAIRRDLQRRAFPLRKVAAPNVKRFRPPALRNQVSESASFNLELPYSNREIANGTNATIRVAVSRQELEALGFPFGGATGDGKYLAEIALGDDGLPRSIRVPLPLKSLN